MTRNGRSGAECGTRYAVHMLAEYSRGVGSLEFLALEQPHLALVLANL